MENSWQIVCEKNSRKSYDSDELLRVKPGCNLKIRLIGHPVKVVRVFSRNRKSIVIDDEETGRRLKNNHADKISNVVVRYACWAIDRDGNTLKILDMPASVARVFGSRAEIVGKNISGAKEGCDWAIGTNGKKGKDVRYTVVYLAETPLTEEERQMVKNRKEDKESSDLREIFKSYGFKEAEEKLLESSSSVLILS